MAYFKFVKNIIRNTLEIYGNGEMYRDFTYIDDIITGILKLLEKGGPKGALNNEKNNTPYPYSCFIIKLFR